MSAGIKTNRRILFSFAVVASLTGAARADVSNRNLLPIGDREAFLSNSGINSPSGGAVFHNPANLARIQHPSISLSGTTLLRFQVHSEEYISGEPLDSKGFVVIPGALISTYEIGRFRLATAILVPDAFENQHKGTYPFDPSLPNQRATILMRTSREDLWLGGGIARQFGRVSVGLSVFGIRRSKTALMFFHVKDETNEEIGSQFLFDTAWTVYGVSAIAGAHLQLSDAFSIGVRAQSPMLHLKSRSDVYLSIISATEDGEGTGVFDTQLSDIEVRDPLPIDFGIGLSYRPHARVELVLDASLQTGTRYRSLNSELLLTDPIHLRPAPRASLGAELLLSPSFRLLGGGFYNRSAVDAQMDAGEQREHYYGGTLGMMFEKGRTRSGLGTFIARSYGKLAPLTDMDRRAEAHTTLLAALITVCYSL